MNRRISISVAATVLLTALVTVASRPPISALQQPPALAPDGEKAAAAIDKQPSGTPMVSVSSEHYEFLCPAIEAEKEAEHEKKPGDKPAKGAAGKDSGKEAAKPATIDPAIAEAVRESIGSPKGGLAILEAAYKNYTVFLGASPKLKKDEKLKVRLHATDGDWQAALKKEGCSNPEAGGMYWPPTKSTSLFLQPTFLYTRTLMLHEAFHQFHFLARGNNNQLQPTWYVEGLAEYVSRHTWDGTTLKTAVVQSITVEDYWAKALAYVNDKSFVLANVVDGEIGENRPVWMALIAYLCEGDGGKFRKRFDALAKQFDSGNSNNGLFRSLVGDPAQMQKAFASWLAGRQEPWSQLFNNWEGIGDGRFLGRAGVVSACCCKADAREITATLEIPKVGEEAAAPGGAWKGGLLLGWMDNDEYTVALISDTGRTVVHRRHNNKWNVLYDESPPPKEAGDKYVLRAVRKGATVTLWLDGTELGDWPVEGAKFGLALDNCRVTFRDVKVTLANEPVGAEKPGKDKPGAGKTGKS